MVVIITALYDGVVFGKQYTYTVTNNMNPKSPERQEFSVRTSIGV